MGRLGREARRLLLLLGRRVMDGRLVGLSPAAAVAAPAPILRASVERSNGRLSLRYVFAGSLTHVELPTRAPAPTRMDGLWNHTCLEAFLAPAGSPAYWEVNVSPSGNWNVYRFDGYRENRRPDARATAALIGLERASCGTLTARAVVDLASLPELRSDPLDVSLAAVLEASDGTLSYWTVAHRAARPDFHRRESFVLQLDEDRSP